MSSIFIPSEWLNKPSEYNSISKLTENLDANNFQVVNLKNPTLPTDAVNKQSVESLITATALIKNSEIDMQKNKIINLGSPQDLEDAVNKSYLDNVCLNFIKKNSAIDMNSNRILNLGKPVGENDAVSKSYVDNIKEAIKQTPTAIPDRSSPLYYGYAICNNEFIQLSFTDTHQKSGAKLSSLKIEAAGIHNLKIWVQIFSDTIETVSLKIFKNDEESPVIKKVFYKTDDDHDSYYSAIADFEKGDSLQFHLAGTNQFSVYYYIEIEHRGVLPEIQAKY